MDDRYASALNQLLRAPFGYVPSVPRNNTLDMLFNGMGFTRLSLVPTY